MIAILRALLNKSFKSWTVWVGVAIAVLSSVQPVVDAISSMVGAVSPALAVKLTAVTLVVTRLRSILLPILMDLKGEK